MSSSSHSPQLDNSDNSDNNSTNKTNLIVNYLPQTMTQEEFLSLFSRMGEMVSCKLLRDKTTRLSLGYGFVNYVRPEDAQKAIDTLDGLRMQNKIIKVSFARPSSELIKGTNLYVVGLPMTMTQTDLEQMFAVFGKIISCRILYDTVTRLSKGVGFVRFDRKDEAENAIQQLNGTVPEGGALPMTVKFANNPQTLETAVQTPQHRSQASFARPSNSSGEIKGSNLYVAGLPMTLMQKDLEQMFDSFGKIMSCRILYDNVTRLSRGVGFVHFERRIDAENAIQQMNGTVTHGGMQPITVRFANNPAAPETTSAQAAQQLNEAASALVRSRLWNEPQESRRAPGPIMPSASSRMSFADYRYSPLRSSSSTGYPPSSTMTAAASTSPAASVAAAPTGFCLFVYNLAPETDDSTLWQLFGPFGAVLSVKVIRNFQNNQCKGYGFVNMANYEDALIAIANLHGTALADRVLQVSFKDQQPGKSTRPLSGNLPAGLY